MYKEFEIYFCDLNKDAQKRLLEFVGLREASEANWDDSYPYMAPIAYYCIETEEEDNEQ